MNVEFVNREIAESEAARAIGLLNQSDEAKVEAWFAMQAVADQVGPASNVGVRGLAWRPGKSEHGAYKVQVTCADGKLDTRIGGPATLEEARGDEWLPRVCGTLERLISEHGGLVAPDFRPNGVGDALLAAVVATKDGATWAARFRTFRGPKNVLLNMVKVADRYGREGVFPHASIYAHASFLTFDNRAELVREFPSPEAARAKAMSMRAGAVIPERPRTHVAPTRVSRLAINAGVSRAEARTILRAVIDGRSKTKLIRAVNEAVRMVDAMEVRESSKVSA